MKELGREARALLDAAAAVNSAPAGVRQRGRRRLVSAVAAGTIATSTVMANAAWLSTSSVAGTASVVAGAGSMGATLFGAIVVGLSTGLVVMAPTSSHVNPPAPQGAVGRAQAPAAPSMSEPSRAGVTPKSLIANVEPVTSAGVVSIELPNSAIPRRASLSTAAPPIEVETARATSEPPTVDVTPEKPTKTSIARETELLAEVQRALKSGRALLAIATLDRYAEECPRRLLNEEAMASRVVATCSLGRVDEGRRLEESFQRQYPNSPLLSRVRSACPKANPGTFTGQESNR